MKVARRFRDFYQQDTGNFTVEASLVFPIILLVTFSMILLSLVFYQKVILTMTATTTAERVAFTWNNSHRNVVTGAEVPGQYDGLYHEMFGNGWFIPFTANQTQVSVHGNSKPHNLTERKLMQGTDLIPKVIDGTVEYSNRWLMKKIQIHLSETTKVPMIFQQMLNQSVVQSTSNIEDPVGFIRNIDFIRKQLPALKPLFAKLKEKKKTQQQISLFSNDTENAASRRKSYSNEKDARRDFQESIQGQADVHRTTRPVDQYRFIDVLDQNGVVHEVLLDRIPYNAEKREEIKKDVQLLQTGKVKGIVWEFFKKTDGGIGPTPRLLQALQKNGIIVNIHD